MCGPPSNTHGFNLFYFYALVLNDICFLYAAIQHAAARNITNIVWNLDGVCVCVPWDMYKLKALNFLLQPLLHVVPTVGACDMR
jgi:hypothetical protein